MSETPLQTPLQTPLPDRVRTPRLTLRTFEEEDVERFAPLIGDWQVARWLARVPHPYSLENGRKWVVQTRRFREERSALDLLAVRTGGGHPVGGHPVGGVGLSLDDGEVGYWVGVPHQGAGYATEMVRGLLRTAFTGLGLRRLWARTAPDNGRSRRVLEKAGFVYLGRHRHDGTSRDDIADVHHYALTADRWRTLTEESA